MVMLILLFLPVVSIICEAVSRRIIQTKPALSKILFGVSIASTLLGSGALFVIILMYF